MDAKIEKGAEVVATVDVILKPEVFVGGKPKDYGLGPGVVYRFEVTTTNDDRGGVALMDAQDEILKRCVETKVTSVRPKTPGVQRIGGPVPRERKVKK